MNISELIGNITDRARFEKIAVDILREIKPELVNVIHGGINAKGETIPSPLDAFQRLSDGNFVLIEVTTDDSGLKNKWLHPQKGDLFKAARKADEWRKQFPTAIYTVWLCTNQPVKDDKYNQLFTATIQQAHELNLTIEFLERSAIAAFLENNPTGQWIAQKYLGITAQRLSTGKFIELSQLNLDQYEREIYVDVQRLVTRSQQQSLHLQIAETDVPILLIGTSGTGKSTLSYSLLMQWQQQGKACLRIRPENAMAAMTAVEAVEKQLLQQQSNLHISRDFFYQRNEEKVLLIIDDLNQSLNPQHLLEHILNWQKDPTFCIVIPVWQNVIEQLPYQTQKDEQARFAKAFVGTFSETEAVAVLTASLNRATKCFPTEQLNRIANELSYDPFLIAIYCDLEGLDERNWLVNTQNPIETYIDEKLKLITSQREIGYYQLRTALNCLADTILKKKQMQISLDNKYAVLEPETVATLNLIGKTHSIFSVANSGEIIFKHDKIRDHLLSKRIESLFDEPDLNESVLVEPYFAELIGKALGNLDLETLKGKIEWFLTRLPLSVVESLNFIQDSTTNQLVSTSIIDWLKTYKQLPDDTVIRSIETSLTKIYNPFVPAIAFGMEQTVTNMAARFLNGETEAGARFLSCFAKGDFEPTFGNLQRDRLFENFNTKFRAQGIAETKILLSRTRVNEHQKNAILLLSGYLRAIECYEDIYKLWKSDQEKLLLSAIWAMIACYDKDKPLLLQEKFDYWASLPPGKETTGFPEGTKDLTAYYLGTSKFHDWHDSLVNVLIANGADENYLDLVWPMLAKIDHPDALEFVVRRLGKVDAELDKRKGEGLFLASITLSEFPKKWSGDGRGGKRMSREGKAKLKTIWMDFQRNVFERYQAFRLWAANTETSDLSELQQVQENEQKLFPAALAKRLILKDHSAFPIVKILIAHNDRRRPNWLIYLSFIWGAQVKSFVKELININKNKISQDYEYSNSRIIGGVADLLAYCPAEDTSDILVENWHFLQYEPTFLMLAMLTGTKACSDLLSKTILQIPDPEKVFKYLRIRLAGGQIINEEHFKKSQISAEAFENMKPYLKYFPENAVREIAELAGRQNLKFYIKENLIPYLKDDEQDRFILRQFFPSEDDLFNEFMRDVADRNRRWHIDHWLQELPKRGITKPEILQVVVEAIEKSPFDTKVIDGCVNCIEQIGDRNSLQIIAYLKGDPQLGYFYENARYSLYRRVLN